MKKIMSLIISCVALLPFYAEGKEVDINKLSAGSAVLISADNNNIIFNKNERERRPIASTTKIMTAILTLEETQQNDRQIKITSDMVPVEGSSMYLKEGDVLTLESLTKGMLAVSGNDAAHSAAIAIAGDLSCFADMMNEKAKAIGMRDTHFATPSGLEYGEHYSTAYDMAILGSYAMDNAKFREIVSRKEVSVPFIVPNETRKLKNSNRLLREYPGCIGIKTGYTKLAKRCLVSCAEREGVRLVCVTLNAPDDWADHKLLFDYGFSAVELMTIGEDEQFQLSLVGAEQDSIDVKPRGTLNVTVEKGCKNRVKKTVEMPKFVYAPIRQGEMVGSITYSLDDKFIGKVDLVSQGEYSKLYRKSFWEKINFLRSKKIKQYTQHIANNIAINAAL